jgi:hypothetical protein
MTHCVHHSFGVHPLLLLVVQDCPNDTSADVFCVRLDGPGQIICN